MKNMNNVLTKTLSIFALAIAGWLPLSAQAANEFDTAIGVGNGGGCSACHGLKASLINPANGASYLDANAIRGANNPNYISRLIDTGDMTPALSNTVISAVAADLATIGIAPTITSSVAPGGTVGVAYSKTVTATGKPTLVGDQNTDLLTTTNDYSFIGMPAYGGYGARTAAFRMLSSVPPGLAINPRTGVISGTPTTAGTYSGTLYAYNNIGSSSTQAYSITIAKGTQSVSFTSSAPTNATPGGSTYSPTATSSSGQAVTFTVYPSYEAYCSITANVVTFLAAGPCYIEGNAPSNANWNATAIDTYWQYIPVKNSQTISYTSTSPTGTTYVGGPTYTPTATSTSGLTVALQIWSGSSSVCTMSAGVVSFIGLGTCWIQADQAGNGSYHATGPTYQSVAVRTNQSATFTSSAPAATVGGATYTPTGTATTGLAVSFSIWAGSSAECSISAGVVTFLTVGAGSCWIHVDELVGNSTYNNTSYTGGSWQQVFIGKGIQTITFGANPGPKTYGNAPFAVSATTNSSSPVTFTSTTLGVCTVAGSTVTIVTAGTCTIAANAATDANYLVATQVTQNITINKAVQTITFGAQAGQTYSPSGTFAISPVATTPSSSPIVYSSTTLGVCTIAGSTVTIVTAGTCTIAANAATDTNYLVASQVTANIAIAKATQTIVFGANPGPKTYGDAAFAVSATSPSSSTVVKTSTTLSVCTIAGSTVTILTAGTCTIAANAVADTNYLVAAQVTQNITINKATQTITFGAQAGQTYAPVTAFALSPVATTPSSSPVVYTSTTLGVCTIAGTTVTIVTAGTCTIAANAAADTNYNIAAQVTANIVIAKATQTISFGANPGPKNYGDAAFAVSATTTSSSPVTFTSTTLGVCTVAGSTVTIVTAGTCTIAANAIADTNYLVAAQVTQNITINKIAQVISFGVQAGQTYSSGGSFAVSPVATTPSSSPIVYTSTTLGVCTVAGSTVTIVTAGTCTIAANAATDTNYLVAAQVTQNVAIAKATQTITFGANPGPKTYGDAAFAVSATTPSTSPVVYSSTTLGVCTVAGSTVTIVTAGTCTIAANAIADTNYLVAAQVTQNITINKATQTITFGANPGPKNFGDAAFAVSATTPSTSPVVYTSTTLGVCTVAGSTVTIVTAGACTIAANAIADTNYLVAAQVTQNITINQIAQTITFGANPGPKTFGDAAFAVSASTTSSSPVTFTSTTLGVCTVAGSTVTIVTAGTCTIAANAIADTNYNAATQTTQNITINQAAQTISFTSSIPGSPVVTGTYTPTATSTSGLSVIITIDVSSAAICSISAGLVTFNANGTCTINANQAGNGNYAAAAQQQQNVVVGLSSQTITFGANPGPKNYGDAAFAVSATASSGLSVTFTSTTLGVCTIAGSTVTIVTAGTCTIAGNQAGNGVYSAAPEVTQNITINKIAQTITFGANPGPKNYGDAAFAVSASTTSTSPVTFTSTTLGVCTVAGSTVTIVTAGTCTIAANAVTDTNYLVATQVTQNITINKIAQTITFGANPGPKNYGDAAFAVSASTTSSSPVTFTSTTLGVCTVAGSTVTIVTAGTCTIAANAVTDTNYLVAAQVTQNITINKIAQTITFGANPGPKNYGDAAFAVSASTTSSSPVTFTSTTLGVCTVAGSMVTIVTAGTCTIAANAVTDTNYLVAAQVTQNITINKIAQTITFGANPGPKTLGDAPFAVSATTPSTSPVVFTSTTLGVCTVAASTVTIVSAGTCTIAANAVTDTNYLVAAQVTQNITINSIQDQTITVTTAAPAFAIVSATFPVIATASSGLTVAITTSGGCTGSGSGNAMITMTSGVTTCVVMFNQAGNGSYNPAPQVTNNTNPPVTVLPLDGNHKGAVMQQSIQPVQ